MPSGLSAAGRSLMDPATACKCEAKKREVTMGLRRRRRQRAKASNDDCALCHDPIV